MKLSTMAVCLLMSCGTACADKSSILEHASQSGTAENLTVGREFAVNRQTYQLLPEIFAVKRSDAKDDPREALMRIGVDATSLVDAKRSYIVFRANQPSPRAAMTQAGTATVFPTVINKRTKAIGVLQGTLIVKLKQMADADSIGSTHGLQLVKQYPQIQTVVYRVPTGVDLIASVEAVASDGRVASAYPDILEHERVPN